MSIEDDEREFGGSRDCSFDEDELAVDPDNDIIWKKMIEISLFAEAT